MATGAGGSPRHSPTTSPANPRPGAARGIPDQSGQASPAHLLQHRRTGHPSRPPDPSPPPARLPPRRRVHRRDDTIASLTGLRLSPEATRNDTSGAKPARERDRTAHRRPESHEHRRTCLDPPLRASGTAFYRGPTLLQSRSERPLQNHGLTRSSVKEQARRIRGALCRHERGPWVVTSRVALRTTLLTSGGPLGITQGVTHLCAGALLLARRLMA